MRLADSVASSARLLRLSNSTTSWFLDRATPGQLQAVDELFSHELAVREANKRARLMRQARFPAVKSVDSFDHTDLTFQGGYGWDDLLSLAWLDRRQDFVFHGPTGRGNYVGSPVMLRNGP